jgi:hypothetical protein
VSAGSWQHGKVARAAPIRSIAQQSSMGAGSVCGRARGDRVWPEGLQAARSGVTSPFARRLDRLRFVDAPRTCPT